MWTNKLELSIMSCVAAVILSNNVVKCFSTSVLVGGNGFLKCSYPRVTQRQNTAWARYSSSTTQDELQQAQHSDRGNEYNIESPWNNTKLELEAKRKNNGNAQARFRQHVNPLSRKFQQPTSLSDDWPRDAFDDLSKPLHIDIGCGKGGFLLDHAKKSSSDPALPGSERMCNHLGLEIRPLVAHYAKERIEKHGVTGRVDFIGCNANVDLERLLRKYRDACSQQNHAAGGFLELVTIQFPDPHFKKSHAKRRVVTPVLVQTLAKFMHPGATVFLQSDVQSVLDDMRIRFRQEVDPETQNPYFRDQIEDVQDYLSHNILDTPTEREISVLNNDLPVYRTALSRTDFLL